MTTVTWVLDSNSKYEVSSKEHMLQLMTKGTLYTDAGSPPSSYWSSDYIQTADIDLESDSNITPIGMRDQTINSNFTGDYDGAEFSISNWSYTDVSTTIDGCSWYVGLFGAVTNCMLKNIRMKGVCTLDGYKDSAGFICGAFSGTSSCYNVELDLSDGSFMVGGKTGGYAGTAIGFGCTTMVGVTVKGIVEHLQPDPVRGQGFHGMGGVVGTVSVPLVVENIRNLATFKNGIHGNHVGGIYGRFGYASATVAKNIVNAMKGDLVGVYTGGIWGLVINLPDTCQVTNVVNAMTGNITGSGQWGAGGIIGYAVNSSVNMSYLMNYMTGDIINDPVWSNRSPAGIIGYLQGTGLISFSNSIVAMNGNCTNVVTGGGNAPGATEVYLDASFGMVYTDDTYVTTNALTGYLYDTTFTDLPYVDMTNMDTEGNVYNWDFVFANLGGNPSYSDYTHLSLHTGEVSSPLYTVTDIPSANTTVYLTYGNLGDSQMFTASSLTILSSEADTVFNYDKSVVLFGVVPSFLTFTPGVINIKLDIQTIAGAVAYRVSYQEPTGSEKTAYTGFTSLSRNIKSLSPETEYTVRFYVNYGSGYTLLETNTITTLANSASNYMVNDFLDNGVFDLNDLDDTSRDNMSAVMNDLFTTGDKMNITVGGKTSDASFVKRGETASVEDSDALLLPFDSTAGSAQTVSLTLSDNATTVAVTYDESANTIEVESTVYNPGEFFILDGKKVSVFEY